MGFSLSSSLVLGNIFHHNGYVPTLNTTFGPNAITSSVGPVPSFSRASYGTYVSSSGMILSTGNNNPRFDYDPTTHEYKGLLIEGASTNYVLNSQNPSTQVISVSSDWLVSFYGSGSVIFTDTITSDVVPIAGSSIGTNRTIAYLPYNDNPLTITISGTVKYLQMEVYSNNSATSWIPTGATPVSRAADVLEYTGSNFSSFYNTSEGSYALSLSLANNLASDPTGTEFRTIMSTNSETWIGDYTGGYMFSNGYEGDVMTGIPFPQNNDFRFLSSYKDDIKISFNGNLMTFHFDANGPSTATTLFFGSPANCHLKNLKYYPSEIPLNKL